VNAPVVPVLVVAGNEKLIAGENVATVPMLVAVVVVGLTVGTNAPAAATPCTPPSVMGN
jgi:hypothetical protein